CSVGLSLNFKLVFNAFSGKAISSAPVIETMAEVVTANNPSNRDADPFPVALDELDDLLTEGALLVDSRSVADYRQSHITGAVSLPLNLAADQMEKFKSQVPFERILVTYCSGYGCPDSFDLGVLLLQEGYQEVLVYEGGLPEWQAAGRPLERNPQ
ncbi:MAG: rhodanese-like domain-containing protein, partial [Deltaproteobacteria bacterium]|nr:rhodanese-like domain-containing protein [Deltaproteobacteria bacterium]